jgi:hypothetical protein
VKKTPELIMFSIEEFLLIERQYLNFCAKNFLFNQFILRHDDNNNRIIAAIVFNKQVAVCDSSVAAGFYRIGTCIL